MKGLAHFPDCCGFQFAPVSLLFISFCLDLNTNLRLIFTRYFICFIIFGSYFFMINVIKERCRVFYPTYYLLNCYFDTFFYHINFQLFFDIILVQFYFYKIVVSLRLRPPHILKPTKTRSSIKQFNNQCLVLLRC